jgi:hypothetical protein
MTFAILRDQPAAYKFAVAISLYLSLHIFFQHLADPVGHVAATLEAGGSSQPGTQPKPGGAGDMPSQQARASVPANVLLFGPGHTL